MLLRFCLYGFLKNQRYFEAFLVLAFLEKGLTFFAIGLLIGFREVCINLFEIPSGAVADLHGRRRAMIFSFSAYLVAFAVFTAATALPGINRSAPTRSHPRPPEGSRAIGALIAALYDPSPHVRDNAARSLGRIGPSAAAAESALATR